MKLLILKKGTLDCPHCKERLHFETFQGMRIIRDGVISARCPKKPKLYYNVRA
jgi:hypothetical protein